MDGGFLVPVGLSDSWSPVMALKDHPRLKDISKIVPQDASLGLASQSCVEIDTFKEEVAMDLHSKELSAQVAHSSIYALAIMLQGSG